ncbi:hypothetical protein CDL15_Pgr017431 [Punica granatum]|uniref:Uncharacterized protein n=1 Tax=Punica granatum TaxID=22663 RepID=A0A218WRT9_PUNGR|nr:hypothetical protein CDL15_Pgr017431 [Punica granatum]
MSNVSTPRVPEMIVQCECPESEPACTVGRYDPSLAGTLKITLLTVQTLALSVLFNLFLNPDLSPGVAPHLQSSLAEFVQSHGNCTLAVRLGAIPALLRLAKSGDEEDLAATSLTILGLLGCFDDGLRALRKTDGIVASMVDVMEGRSMLSKEGAADVLL